MTIAVIDSTIRKESRTREIMNNVLNHFKDDIDFKIYNINEYELIPTNMSNFDQKGSEEFFFELSKEIASMDGMIIAAPFWDMTYPALLKVFLEKLSIPNVMFLDGTKEVVGLSNNKFMLFLTTRGLNIETYSKYDGASPSLKALCELWGIKHFACVGAHNMDYSSPSEIEEKIESTSKEAIAVLNELINK